MDGAFDESDVQSILSGIFHMNAHLTNIAEDIHAIRMLLEDGSDEEEEEGGGDDSIG